MPDPDFDPLAILRILEEHGVAYVLIGGFAATVHGSPLRTDDADICAADDDENLERLAAALGELDARIAVPDGPEGVAFPRDPDFLGRVTIWNLVTLYGRLDISFRPSGTQGYTDLRKRAVEYDLGDGLVVPVAALIDVIRSKEAAARDKDRRALPVLRQLLERIDEEEHG
jgi:hypothetical protein